VRLQHPRAFQIRFGGVKGVVYTAADSLLIHEGKRCEMLLRKSQMKFTTPESAECQLRVVSSTGEQHQCLFFDSALKAFEDSGADTGKIEEIFGKTYDELANGSSTGLGHLQQIFRISNDFDHSSADKRHHLLKLAVTLKHLSPAINPEDYPHSFLALYLTKLGQRVRDRDMFKIPIPGSYNVLGLTDDYGILDRMQVIVRAHGRTIDGKVLLYRDPIIHIGDIQIANALSEREIEAVMIRRVTELRLGFVQY
jgi:hypothetical protein